MSPRKPARGCKSCRFANVVPDRAGRYIMRSDRPYRCEYPLPELPLPPLPASVALAALNWPPPRVGIWSDDGEDCATWEPRS